MRKTWRQCWILFVSLVIIVVIIIAVILNEYPENKYLIYKSDFTVKSLGQTEKGHNFILKYCCTLINDSLWKKKGKD